MIELSVDNTAVDPVAGSARYVAEAFSRLAKRATNEAKQAANRNRVIMAVLHVHCTYMLSEDAERGRGYLDRNAANAWWFVRFCFKAFLVETNLSVVAAPSPRNRLASVVFGDNRRKHVPVK